jgi:hypothetical protein
VTDLVEFVLLGCICVCLVCGFVALQKRASALEAASQQSTKAQVLCVLGEPLVVCVCVCMLCTGSIHFVWIIEHNGNGVCVCVCVCV